MSNFVLLLYFIETVAAGVGCDKLRFAARIFAAVKRTNGIDFASAKAFFVYA